MVKSVRIAVAAGLLAAATEPAAAFHPVGGALFRAPGTFFKVFANFLLCRKRTGKTFACKEKPDQRHR